MGFSILDLSLAGIGIYLLNRLFTKRPRAPLPPGPKGLPLLGNLLDVPTGHQWLGFAKFKDLYGARLSFFS